MKRNDKACLPAVFLPSVSVLALASVLIAGSSASAVTMSVVSPPAVKAPGDTATVCVALSAGSQQIAGTQNELRWDANCASMIDQCVANPSHRKSVNVSLTSGSGMKALVLSFSDVRPIPDGDLYCCTFRIHLETPGSCCPITMADALASDPDGGAVAAVTRGGQLCLASGPSSAGGIQPRAGSERPPVVGTDLGTGAREVAPAEAPAAAAPKGGPVGGAPPAVVVQPGGEAEPEEPETAPAEQRVAQAPGQAPGLPAGKAPPAVTQEGGAAAPAEPVTRAATPVAAKPTPGEAVPTVAKPTAKPPAKVEAPTKAPGGSGCNCQIAGGGSDGSLLASLTMFAVMLLARRKRI